MPTRLPDHFIHVFNYTSRAKTNQKRLALLQEISILYEWLETKIPHLYKSKCGKYIDDCLIEEGSSLPGKLTRIISREFNGVVLMITGGAYDSAARTLRWMLETTIKAFVAVDDKSILTGDATHKGASMTFEEFIEFLEFTDSVSKDFSKNSKLTTWVKNKRVGKEKKRPTKLRGIGNLPNAIENRWLDGLEYGDHKKAELIYFTYSQLSSYTHTNLRDFRIESEIIPFVYYEPKEFKKVFQLAVQTSDIVIYLLIMAIYTDVGFYSWEFGEQFQETIIKELSEGMEEQENEENKCEKEKQLFFFQQLPSLRGLVFGHGPRYSKQIRDSQIKQVLLEAAERNQFTCPICPEQFTCKRFLELQERFGKQEWFEKLLKESG